MNMIRPKCYLFLTILFIMHSCSDLIELENGNLLEIKKNNDNIITDSLTYNKDGKLEGLIKTTEENFTIYVDYVNGVRDGEYKAFYKNGELNNHGFYTNGRKWREWVKYKENGEWDQYETFTPNEESIYFRNYEDGKVIYKRGEAFMFYNSNPNDSILYVGDTLLTNIFISYPPNCILKARTLLFNPYDSIVSAKEYTFNKTFITIKENFNVVGTYKIKTLWIMKDTIENKIEKGTHINEFEIRKKT